jgi:hypothetical protein
MTTVYIHTRPARVPTRSLPARYHAAIIKSAQFDLWRRCEIERSQPRGELNLIYRLGTRQVFAPATGQRKFIPRLIS